MENLLISACFLGYNVKYNGLNNYRIFVLELKKKYNLIPICPEVSSGLSIPRNPSEILGDKVITSNHKDVTEYFNNGALKALNKCLKYKCMKALLKESSPSCGVNMIYDGTFNSCKIDGMGVTAKLLKENGIKLYTENDIEELLKWHFVGVIFLSL